MMKVLTLLLALPAFAAAFRLPFKLAAVTNVTQGGETLTQQGTYFVANITIGTPPQVFSVVIDTTTADLIVPDLSCDVPKGVCSTDDCTGVFCSDLCPNKKCCIQINAAANSTCYGKSQFYSAKSSTYQEVFHAYTVSNQYGQTSGFTGQDVVTLGDLPADSITVPGVSFLQAVTIGSAYQSINADGILGLAFGSVSQTESTPAFIQAVQQQDVVDSVFSIWLEHQNQTDDLGTHGVIYYGGYDYVHCEKNRSQVLLTSASKYQVTAQTLQASVTGSPSVQSTKSYQAVADSTQPWILAPTPVYNQILGLFNYTGALPAVVPCNTDLKFTFTFPTGASADIAARDLIQQVSPGVCTLLLGESSSQYVLGLPFFRGRCVYFDVNRHTLGFARALLQD